MILENVHDSKLLFHTVDKLLQNSIDKRYPSANSDQELVNAFADFLSAKIVRIRDELLDRKEKLGERTMEDFECTSCFSEFTMVTDEDVSGLIRGLAIKACALDPLPASIMRKCYSSLIPIFSTVINLLLSSEVLPKKLKVALLSPFVKKLNAEFEQFSNFRPVSNLKFISKLIEKSVFVQLNSYLGEMVYMSFFNQRIRFFTAPRLHFSLSQTTLCCHWIRARMFSLSYWICRKHLIPLTIPCCWHDYRNHLVSVELYCNGSILFFLMELSLLTSMRRILRYQIFPWVFPMVQSWDLYSTFCILRHLLK